MLPAKWQRSFGLPHTLRAELKEQDWIYF